MTLNQLRALASALLIAACLQTPPATAQTPAHFEDRTTFVQDREVRYRIAGSGPYLLMVNDPALAEGQWKPVAQRLAADYTVIVAELPGNRASPGLAGDFRYDQAAMTLHALLDSLDAGRAYGIGHSAGAVALLYMAAQRPRRFVNLVLVEGMSRIRADSVAQEMFRALPHDNLRVVPGSREHPQALPQRVHDLLAFGTR
jgi:pimeloyl-ACP methyl ester carboxylesterase